MNDVPMLVSAINFLLRDHEFETLDEICNHFNVNRAALEAQMATQGFEWSEQQKNSGKEHAFNYKECPINYKL